MSLLVSGIAIEVCKKRIKNMHLYVKPPHGRVTVSAPLAMSDAAIQRFVRTKLGWIKRQMGKFDAQPRQTEREYVSGETLYVWGKQFFLQVEYANRYALTLSGEKAIFAAPRESVAAQRENFMREWYREQLKTEMRRLLPKWERLTGLRCASWQTKYMTTRWGTCNTTSGKIWLNVQLAKKPLQCLEYVLLHELVHLVEKRHNERFVALMDKHMPMWREIKSTLNGQIL